MINKKLRILIAESDHGRLLYLEKMLNQLGYYCIAPMSSFEELFSILYGEGRLFDVLFVNAALLADHGFELVKLLERKKRILNTLIYDEQSFSVKPVPLLLGSAINVFMTPVVSVESMRAYMDIVDPVEKGQA